MKSQRTNAFQLMIAGAVLVLVIICGTFAWFAVGKYSSLRNVRAEVGNGGIPNQLNYIHYSDDGKSWEKYNGQNLAMEPGKVWHFRAGFTANDGVAVKMLFTNIDGSYRAPVELSTSESSDGEEIEVTTLPPTTDAAPFTDVLEYRVNPAGDSAAFAKLKDALDSNNKRIATILDAELIDASKKDGAQYVYYFDVKMSGEEATNDYEDLSLSFDLELQFQQTLN